MSSKTKRIALIGMLCALAYVTVALSKLWPIPLIPAVPFLKYDPKDVIILIGGFMFGPLASFLVSVIVSFLEMITFSETGIWGFLMNVLSTCSFACTAALIYKKNRKLSGAVISLGVGVVSMVGVMLLWNYLITPIYMGYPREAVAKMLLPAFLPFNIIKGVLNAVLTLLLYKPLVTALRKAHMLEAPEAESKGKISPVVLAVSLLALVSCVLLVLALNGII